MKMTEALARWIVLWCWAVIGIGAVIALSVFKPLAGPTMLFLDLAFWPLDGRPVPLAPEAQFATALIGALMVGWGVLMLALVRDPVLSRNVTVWRALTTSVVVWFLADSAASWLTGARLNVLGNIGFLLTFLIPVLKSGVLSQSAPART
jgi:hypothetical protein